MVSLVSYGRLSTIVSGRIFQNLKTSVLGTRVLRYQSSVSSPEVNIIEEESYAKSPLLVTLHARLELPSSFPLKTLSQVLTCPTTREQRGINDNYGLNILGKNLLTYYITEYLVSKYPRIPLPILNSAINSYIGIESLYYIGKSWGIETNETTEFKSALKNESAFYKFGKLRFNNKFNVPEPGITQISSASTQNNEVYSITEFHAYSSAVRSLIGALYAHVNESYTKKFIYDHILSRKVEIEKMFEFQQPTRELSRLCLRENLSPPIARLLAETGRNSATPVFIVGIFSGLNKLGEGQGSSLNEAKTRAAVHALKSYYLYQPVEFKTPSDESYNGGVLVSAGDVVV